MQASTDQRAERHTPGAWPPRLPQIEVRRGVVAGTELLDGAVDALVVPVAPAPDGEEGVQPRSGTADAAARYGVDLADLAERTGMTGAAGEAETVHLPRGVGEVTLPWHGLPSRLVLVGVGGAEPADYRRTGAAIAKATRGLGTVITPTGTDAGPAGVQALTEGYLLGSYRHPSARTTGPPPGPAEQLVLLGRHSPDAVDRGTRAALATWTARVLTVTPSDVKTPAWLAERAQELGEAAGLAVERLDVEQLVERGFGGIVAVGAGSASPPCLVTLRYEPSDAVLPRHVVIVGKGITYDTGGLSIKPRESMTSMKTDMAGAAVALATVVGAAQAKVPHRVTAVLALAENSVGAASYRPGDVLRTYGGTTVEIANTDAEGRIVLADALAHADQDLDPDVLIDVATLTGAATMGLGRQHAALYSDDDELAVSLTAAGLQTGERLWRMPLVQDYLPALDSPVADLRHVPSEAKGGGSITAALFLRAFVGRRRWAHLDIAGPARASAAAHEVPEGATGFGARVLLRWLDALR